MSFVRASRALAILTGLALAISLHSCAFTTDLSGTLTGRVKQAGTSLAISGAVVECEGIIAVSSANGSYSMEGIPPGDRVVYASAGGYDDYAQRVDIHEGTYHDIHMDLEVLPATIAGHVTHHTFGPIEGALVTLGDRSTTTDEDGFYAFMEYIFQESYYMTVTKDGYRPFAQNVTPEGIGYQLPVSLLKLAQTTLWSEGDATVLVSHPNSNFGLETELNLFNNQLLHERFYIVFMMDQVEETAVPTSATLRLHNVWASGDEEHRDILAAATIDPWSESEVTWNDQIQTTGASSVQSSYSLETEWYEIDLTGMFYDWLVDEEPNYGLLIDSPVDNLASRFVFASREHAVEEERPHVVLEYAW
jgi:hypothetical protein